MRPFTIDLGNAPAVIVFRTASEGGFLPNPVHARAEPSESSACESKVAITGEPSIRAPGQPGRPQSSPQNLVSLRFRAFAISRPPFVFEGPEQSAPASVPSVFSWFPAREGTD